MPATYLMSWEPKARRWWIQYKNKRHVVSCRQLGTPQTKDSSYQAANAWWTSKKREVDRLAPPVRDARYPPYHPHEDEIIYNDRKHGWLQSHGSPEEAAVIAKHLEVLRSLGPDDEPVTDPHEVSTIADNIDFAEKMGIQVPADLDPLHARMVFGEIGKWAERLRGDQTPAIPAEKTVAGLIERWLGTQEVKVGTGQLSPGRHNNVRYCLGHFARFIGSDRGVEVIDGERWSDFYSHCLAMVQRRDADAAEKDGWSRDYAAEVFKVSRRFVRWLWGLTLIELPRNLGDKSFTFGGGAKKIKPIAVSDFGRMALEASAKVELYLLLMANCGFRSKDIGDLLDSEVDWEQGRIRRKRSKTRDRKETPEVDYLLWDRTFHLLKRFRAGADRVLLTTTGRPLVEEWLDPEVKKLKSKDAVTMCYQRLQKKTGVRSPLGSIRKRSASLLESSMEYARFRNLFLGHAPGDLGEKSYAETARELFDQAIRWLGVQYGMIRSS